ncbi:hypothetical protein G9A89_003934 [Geosiphon pyriformis]|nr:hypothetical protein G9A89_003934 [Geosiphon pyriformis]
MNSSTQHTKLPKKTDRDSKSKRKSKKEKERKHIKKHEKKRTIAIKERGDIVEDENSSNTEGDLVEEAVWVEKKIEIPPTYIASRTSPTFEGAGFEANESDYRTVFTDFKNPLKFESFKKPQESYFEANRLGTSQKRARSASPIDEVTHQKSKMASVLITKPTLTEDELNKLQAKALRANMLNLPEADLLEQEFLKEKNRCEFQQKKKVEVLPIIDNRGRLYDIGGPIEDETSKTSFGHRKVEKFDTHDKSGTRIRYQKDEDSLTLEDLVRHERSHLQEPMNSQIAKRIIGDSVFEDDLEYMDEQAESLAKSTQKTAQQKRDFMIRDYQKSKHIMEGCVYCLKDNSLPQVPIVSLGIKTYLALPSVTEMSNGHCLIVPVEHCLTMIECDDDIWDEIRNFMKCLIQMFDEANRGVIFMETVVNLGWQKHTVIECIPMPLDLVEDAPAFFKEAIMSSESDWSQNKKLITTTKSKGFRQSMVKELPYFHVWFGLDKGFGHVIENNKKFPFWFGKEIVAGMCDLSPDVWRRPKKLNSKENHRRVQEFIKSWKKWDWTKMLEGGQY